MAGRFWAAALGAALLAGAGAGPALAQYYYPPPAYYPPPPPQGYYPGQGYGGGGYHRQRRVRVSRICATDVTMCYQAPQEIGTWCKCGGGPTRSTGAIVPER
jgi:hypothetical protein